MKLAAPGPLVAVALCSFCAVAAKPRVELAVAAKAPLIAVGRVVKQINYGGQVTLTFELEQSLRGEIPPALELVPPAEALQGLEVGRKLLLFLEPSGKASPKLQIAGGGAAVLWVLDPKNTGTFKVSGARKDEGGVLFPEALCGNTDYCAAELAELLTLLKLPALAPDKPHAPFYRRHTVDCEVCRPTVQLKPLETGSAFDCSTAKNPARCLLEKQPSFYTVPKAVCDSDHRYDFVHDEKGLHEIAFDRLGASLCHATATTRSCGSVKDQAGDRPTCVEPGELKPLCDENPSRVDLLGPPQPIDALTCKLNKLGWGGCDPASTPQPAGKDARDLICAPTQGAHLSCYPLR